MAQNQDAVVPVMGNVPVIGDDVIVEYVSPNLQSDNDSDLVSFLIFKFFLIYLYIFI